MGSAASVLIDSAAARVRDSSNTVHPRATVLDLISRVQEVVNIFYGAVVTTETIAATAGTALYNVQTALTAAARVQSVQINNAHLEPISPWSRLFGLSRTPFTDRDTPRGFALIGRSLLALYPAPADTTNVTVISAKVTATLASEATTLELTTEREALVTDLVTTMLLIRQRDLDQVDAWIKRVSETVIAGVHSE